MVLVDCHTFETHLIISHATRLKRMAPRRARARLNRSKGTEPIPWRRLPWRVSRVVQKRRCGSLPQNGCGGRTPGARVTRVEWGGRFPSHGCSGFRHVLAVILGQCSRSDQMSSSYFLCLTMSEPGQKGTSWDTPWEMDAISPA